MRAVHLTSQGLSYSNDYAPQAREEMIPVQVIKAGICETDLQLVLGYMGFQGVLGHEFAGIAQAGRFKGQRVVGEINCACHQCETCQRGLPTHCPHRSVLGILNHDGAFADFVWLPESNLHAVPDTVSDDAAVFVEPLAAAYQIPAQLNLKSYRNVVVLGDGRLGNLCAQVLHQQKCSLLVIGKHSEKLARLQKLGIKTALLEETRIERMADLVIDCTGSAEGFATACQLVEPRGTLVMKTTVAGQHGPNLAPVVIDEINLVGSRCGPFVPAIEALAHGEIEVESLITSRFPISDSLAAFEKARQKDQLKVILEMNSPQDQPVEAAIF